MKILLKRSTLCFLFSSLVLASCYNEASMPNEFQIEPGFTLSLIAKEPLIEDPVDLEFTKDGTPMVLTMPGYAALDKKSSILLLNDNNNDGVYDDKIIYADNLHLGSSILPYRDGVLVTDAPYLLFLRDTDQDNKMDVTDTIMGGLSTNALSHNFNGLTYGLDNWIYVANGGNGGGPYWWRDSTEVMDLQGQDFRFSLEKGVMERIGHSSGGFGLGMNTWGHLFETHNTNHISHLIFQNRYVNSIKLPMDHNLSNISDHEENGLSRIYPIGEQETRVNHPEQSGYFSGGCGITFYEGGVYGPEYDQTVWVADVVLNLIHIDKIKPKGSSFVASRIFEKKEFLASNDRSFRPVNMTIGPDGSMYVVDMHRKVIEEPEWIPDEIEKDLDLNAGKGQGRLYKIIKPGSTSVVFHADQFKSIAGMISSLQYSNIWVRKKAHQLLMEQTLSNKNIESITELLKAQLGYTRLHAMWILAEKEKLTINQIITLLGDQEMGVRENALQIAERFLRTSTPLLNKCLDLLEDSNPRVRMQAALTISTLSKETFNIHKTKIQTALIKSIDASSDTWNLAAITLAAKHAPAELFKILIEGYNPAKERLLPYLALLCGNSIEEAQIVLQLLDNPKVRPDIRHLIIQQLNAGLNTKLLTGKLLPEINKLENTTDINMITDLATIRSRLKLPPSPIFLDLSKKALQKVLDHSLTDSIRLKQLTLLELVPFEVKSEALFQCLNNSEPIKIQGEALRQLSIYDDPSVGKQLVKKWTSLGPQTRRLAGDVLLFKKVYHDELLTGLEEGTINIGEMNFDLERRRILLRSNDENIKRRAEGLFSDAQVLNRKEAIDKMKPALTLAGSASRGSKIFESLCSNCHLYGSVGQRVGPVLTEINRKSKELLMHDILDPNAAVNTEFINHKVETKEGKVYMGVVDSEMDKYIVIKQMGGAKITINKVDIKNLSSMGTSLMMEGLEGAMSVQEMADLLAFLQQGN